MNIKEQEMFDEYSKIALSSILRGLYSNPMNMIGFEEMASTKGNSAHKEVAMRAMHIAKELLAERKNYIPEK